MKKGNICPYFRDNRCASESCELINLKTMATAICASSDYRECPVFRVSEKKEEERTGVNK